MVPANGSGVVMRSLHARHVGRWTGARPGLDLVDLL
jgi:hypothetical protein